MRRTDRVTLGTWLSMLRLGLFAGGAIGLVLTAVLFWCLPGWWRLIAAIPAFVAPLIGMVASIWLPTDRITPAAFRSAARVVIVLFGASFGVVFFGAFGNVVVASIGALVGASICYISFERGVNSCPADTFQDTDRSGNSMTATIPPIGHVGLFIVAVAILGCGIGADGHIVVSAADLVTSKPGEFAAESVQIGKVKREYRLVVPKTVDLTKSAPLVVAFHGMIIDNKDVMPKYSKLNETAEKEQFVLAFPQALGGHFGIKPDKVKEDLAFFDALIKKLSTDYKIDPDRVYVLGMSNGGYFAHLVAKERSKVVAAVASHSGPLGLQTLLGVHAERKFPVLIIHGDKDRIFPVAFARENRDKYQHEGHEVKYVEITGLDHEWGVKQDINATIWKFFEEHPRKKNQK